MPLHCVRRVYLGLLPGLMMENTAGTGTANAFRYQAGKEAKYSYWKNVRCGTSERNRPLEAATAAIQFSRFKMQPTTLSSDFQTNLHQHFPKKRAADDIAAGGDDDGGPASKKPKQVGLCVHYRPPFSFCVHVYSP